MKNTFCNWAICYDIDGKYYDDGKTRTAIAAILQYPLDAHRERTFRTIKAAASFCKSL